MEALAKRLGRSLALLIVFLLTGATWAGQTTKQIGVIESINGGSKYIIIAGSSRLTKGMIVYVGAAKAGHRYRIEKIAGSRASAIPESGIADEAAGALVFASDGKNEKISFTQDVPLASFAEADAVRQANLARLVANDTGEQAKKEADTAVLLGAVGALATGANPNAVSLAAHLQLAENQLKSEAGQPLDSPRAVELFNKFSTNSMQNSFATSGTVRGSASRGNPGASDKLMAQQIASQCKVSCGSLEQECKNGPFVQAACYKAAACNCECFLNHDTRPETPEIARAHNEWRQCVTKNRQLADNLVTRR